MSENRSEVENETEEQKTTEKPIEMKIIVGIQFSDASKVYSFDANNNTLKLHDLVVVEGDKGSCIGKVIVPPEEKEAETVATNIKKVLRKANEEDIERLENNKEKAMEAFKLCEKKIVDHNLEMKLIDVNILTGDEKAVFYFTADERVDFRALVKDLATSLHTRIEMRQIGARDAAKSIGSIGSCGFTCCCETHLREFKSIAIQMAKNQGLSPNPAKLTGMCGKLKCCLAYENCMYSEFKKTMPNQSSRVKTPKGEGFVTSIDIPRQLVYVRVEDSGEITKFQSSEVQILKGKGPRKPQKESDEKDQKKRPEKRGTPRDSKRQGREQKALDQKKEPKKQNREQDRRRRNKKGKKNVKQQKTK